MIKTIEGIQAAQAGMAQIARAVKPENALGKWTQYVAYALHRYVVTITHVVTGALRGSQRVASELPSRYRIYIDPATKNPKSGNYPAIYGVVEHNRGGSHAFYERSLDSADSALTQGADLFLKELP